MGIKKLINEGIIPGPKIERDPEFSYPTIEEPLDNFFPFVKKKSLVSLLKLHEPIKNNRKMRGK
jgi:hypothetical protein